MLASARVSCFRWTRRITSEALKLFINPQATGEATGFTMRMAWTQNVLSDISECNSSGARQRRQQEGKEGEKKKRVVPSMQLLSRGLRLSIYRNYS